MSPHNEQCKGLEAALGLSAPEAPSFLRLLPQSRASSYVVIAEEEESKCFSIVKKESESEEDENVKYKKGRLLEHRGQAKGED